MANSAIKLTDIPVSNTISLSSKLLSVDSNTMRTELITGYDLTMYLANTVSFRDSVQETFELANVAFIIANNAFTYAVLAADTYQISINGFIQANSAFGHANSAFNQSNSAFNHANSGFNQANSAFNHANSAFSQANTAFDHANSAFSQANTAFDHANSGFSQANTAFDHANSGFSQANSAFNIANTAYQLANSVVVLDSYGQVSSDANLALIISKDSYTQANVAYIKANLVNVQANVANMQANLAYLAANSKFSSSGGTISGEVIVTSNLSVSGNVILSGAPTQTLQAATKQYVDQVAQGISAKPAVKAATTINLASSYNNGTLGVGATLNLGTISTLNVDGITSWNQYDGILVKNQANTAHNGRYYVSEIGSVSNNWVLTRCSYCDEAAEIPSGYVFVQSGNTQSSTGWIAVVNNINNFVVGANSINWIQFSGAGTYIAGGGLSLVGTTFSHSDTSSVSDYSVDNSSGNVIQDLAVTFDTYGHVTNISTTTADLDVRYSGLAIPASIQANTAFNQANLALSTAQSAYDQANTANINAANASFLSTGTVPGDRGVTAGSANSSFVEYNGTTKTNGQFDGGSVAPTNSTRLNYDGNFWATTFVGAGTGLTGTASYLTANVANYEVITNATTGKYYPQLVSETSGTLAGYSNNAFVFDVANNYFGIGTTNPSYNLDIRGTANTGALTSTSIKTSALYDGSNRKLLVKDANGSVVWG